MSGNAPSVPSGPGSSGSGESETTWSSEHAEHVSPSLTSQPETMMEEPTERIVWADHSMLLMGLTDGEDRYLNLISRDPDGVERCFELDPAMLQRLVNDLIRALPYFA